MRTRPTNSDDVIDSRDVEEAISELESELETAFEDRPEAEEVLTYAVWLAQSEYADDEAQELKALLSLREQASGYASDWKYGEILIRDSHFEDYARELADDIGAVDNNASWPYTCIDWKQAAEELQQDYTSVEFDGVTYWVR